MVSVAKKVGMGSKAEADKFEAVFDDAVNQEKVRLDMAVAVPGVLSLEGMVAEGGGKGRLRAEQADGIHDFSRLLPRRTARLTSRLKDVL